MKTAYYLTALTAVLFAACSNESNEINPVEPETETPFTPVALQVQAGISASTRVANGAFEVDDAIGVYAVSTATNGLTSGTNVAYTATNTTADFTSTTPIYFQDRNEVNISAYYPYVKDIKDNTLSVALSDQTDILFAHKDKVPYTETSLALTFEHVLAQITLVLKAGDGLTDLTDLSYIMLKNLPCSASWNVLTGALTNSTDTEDYATSMFTANDDGSQTLSLLLFPVSSTSIELTVNYNDVDYEATLNSADGLVAGNNYTYTVSVKQSGLTVSGSTIQAWTEAELSDSDASSEATMADDGTAIVE